MQAYLKPHIHMTQVGREVVALDVRQDTYFCLAGAAAFLTLGEKGAIGFKTDSAHRALAEADLLSDEPDQQRRALPARPVRAASLVLEAPPTPIERLRFVRTSLTVLSNYRKTSFSCLITDTGPRPADCDLRPESIAINRQVALFAHWLPWVPYQEACLYRAYFLRRFLARGSLAADWVFGVTTWPFSAHCWLQVGDIVLDDDVDRVRSYRPIMVV